MCRGACIRGHFRAFLFCKFKFSLAHTAFFAHFPRVFRRVFRRLLGRWVGVRSRSWRKFSAFWRLFFRVFFSFWRCFLGFFRQFFGGVVGIFAPFFGHFSAFSRAFCRHFSRRSMAKVGEFFRVFSANFRRFFFRRSVFSAQFSGVFSFCGRRFCGKFSAFGSRFFRAVALVGLNSLVGFLEKRFFFCGIIFKLRRNFLKNQPGAKKISLKLGLNHPPRIECGTNFQGERSRTCVFRCVFFSGGGVYHLERRLELGRKQPSPVSHAVRR